MNAEKLIRFDSTTRCNQPKTNGFNRLKKTRTVFVLQTKK